MTVLEIIRTAPAERQIEINDIVFVVVLLLVSAVILAVWPKLKPPE